MLLRSSTGQPFSPLRLGPRAAAGSLCSPRARPRAGQRPQVAERGRQAAEPARQPEGAGRAEPRTPASRPPWPADKLVKARPRP
eukprot:270110-Heterocapsa_arctica.AAC.1